jgi:3-oxoacyl-[acyl-carrier protein] reductase
LLDHLAPITCSPSRAAAPGRGDETPARRRGYHAIRKADGDHAGLPGPLHDPSRLIKKDAFVPDGDTDGPQRQKGARHRRRKGNRTRDRRRAREGIGRAIAVALAKEGVHVGLVARTRSDIEAVAGELAATHGVRTSIATADVANRGEIEAAVASIQKELGTIDILINNAGTAHVGSVLEMDPETWEQTLRVNVLGTYYAVRAVLPGMIEQKRGDIVNVSSTAGERGAANLSAYAASKAAVLRFTESLAAEVRKHDVRVTALLPSTVNTELAASIGLKIGTEDRMMQPDDVAQLTVDALKLPQRVFVRDMAILTTNPQ